MEKKLWQTPHLISLVRLNPEEAVLTVCKYDFAPGAFPSTLAIGCNEEWTELPGGCAACSGWSAS